MPEIEIPHDLEAFYSYADDEPSTPPSAVQIQIRYAQYTKRCHAPRVIEFEN